MADSRKTKVGGIHEMTLGEWEDLLLAAWKASDHCKDRKESISIRVAIARMEASIRELLDPDTPFLCAAGEWPTFMCEEN